MPAVSTQLNDFIRPASPASAPRTGPGFWSRFWTAFQEAQMRRAEREIALLIERRGGRMTDDLERQIERHLF